MSGRENGDWDEDTWRDYLDAGRPQERDPDADYDKMRDEEMSERIRAEGEKWLRMAEGVYGKVEIDLSQGTKFSVVMENDTPVGKTYEVTIIQDCEAANNMGEKP